jgi:hypothetical protein
MSKPVHVLHRGAEVEEIVNIAAIAVVDAQDTETRMQAEESVERGARCAEGPAETDPARS